MNKKFVTLSLILTAGFGMAASAIEIDLTSGSTTIDGAIFTAVAPKGTGTGSFDSFDRIKAESDFIKGVNTSINDYLYDNLNKGGGNFIHDLPIANIGFVMENNTPYYLFQLDIGQPGQNPLSMDRVRLYQVSTPFTDATALKNYLDVSGTPVFDTGTADTFKVTANDGNGAGDLWMYVPTSLLNESKYLYLYSEFGKPPGNYSAAGTFKEWGALKDNGTPPGVPDAGVTLMLLGMGLTGIAGIRRKLQS